MGTRKTLVVAQKCGVSEAVVYRLGNKIKEVEGEWRCPTCKEVRARNSKRGRPRKLNK